MYRKKFQQSAKAFSVPQKAWFGETATEIEKNPYIMIGFYYDNSGTEGEFKIVWTDIGIQLQAFNDAWEALNKMPELLHLLSVIGKKEETPTIEEFCNRLKNLGYQDITEYTINQAR